MINLSESQDHDRETFRLPARRIPVLQEKTPGYRNRCFGSPAIHRRTRGFATDPAGSVAPHPWVQGVLALPRVCLRPLRGRIRRERRRIYRAKIIVAYCVSHWSWENKKPSCLFFLRQPGDPSWTRGFAPSRCRPVVGAPRSRDEFARSGNAVLQIYPTGDLNDKMATNYFLKRQRLRRLGVMQRGEFLQVRTST